MPDLVVVAHKDDDGGFNRVRSARRGGRERTVWGRDSTDALEGDAGGVAAHCFGCTAGSGSSCDGSLA